MKKMKLEEMVKILEQRVPFYGIRYCYYDGWNYYPVTIHKNGIKWAEWVGFYKDEINDQIDNNIKINNVWFNKSDVIIFSQVADKSKEQVECKYKHLKPKK